jgi:hypothetical protein
MERVFADDFVEFGRSGRVYDRAEILAHSRTPIDAVLPLPDYRVRPLSEDIVQITYNSQVTYDGVVRYARRSSIWQRTATGWRLRFHQGTPYAGEESTDAG